MESAQSIVANNHDEQFNIRDNHQAQSIVLDNQQCTINSTLVNNYVLSNRYLQTVTCTSVPSYQGIQALTNDMF